MNVAAIVGAIFVIAGLYCLVMPEKAKLNISLGRDVDRTNFDWMPDGWVRIMGAVLVLAGAAIAKTWL